MEKIKIESPHDPTIPFLGICTKEFKAGSQRDICIRVFIAALSEYVEATQMVEWICQMCYIYMMEYYSAF